MDTMELSPEYIKTTKLDVCPVVLSSTTVSFPSQFISALHTLAEHVEEQIEGSTIRLSDVGQTQQQQQSKRFQKQINPPPQQLSQDQRKLADELGWVIGKTPKKTVRDGYKKTALKWHPDKNVNLQDEEKKIVQQRFKLLSKFYNKMTSKWSGRDNLLP